MALNAAVEGLPKVALHDHLDGGLRVDTILELADVIGYRDLPADEPAGLESWFYQGRSGSLTRYLDAFRHTVGVMQTPEAIERVAFEAVEDLATDHVVYAEFRFAPFLHTTRGMAPEDVIEAALAGLRRGSDATGMVVGLLPSALRDHTDSEPAARRQAVHYDNQQHVAQNPSCQDPMI